MSNKNKQRGWWRKHPRVGKTLEEIAKEAEEARQREEVAAKKKLAELDRIRRLINAANTPGSFLLR